MFDLTEAMSGVGSNTEDSSANWRDREIEREERRISKNSKIIRNCKNLKTKSSLILTSDSGELTGLKIGLKN